jgi:hypothetical protein
MRRQLEVKLSNYWELGLNGIILSRGRSLEERDPMHLHFTVHTTA